MRPDLLERSRCVDTDCEEGEDKCISLNCRYKSRLVQQASAATCAVKSERRTVMQATKICALYQTGEVTLRVVDSDRG